MKPKTIAAPSPLLPADWQVTEAKALQRLADGEASSEQQKLALDFIVNRLCGTYDLSYRPADDAGRDTAFAEGKRFIGLQIVKLLRLNLALFTKSKKETEPNG